MQTTLSNGATFAATWGFNQKGQPHFDFAGIGDSARGFAASIIPVGDGFGVWINTPADNFARKEGQYPSIEEAVIAAKSLLRDKIG
jgi:hypothetical protein